jgi:hypothetical protein
MSIITSISNDELALFKKQYLNATDLKKEIEKLEVNKVRKSKKQEYIDWRDSINFYIDLYNLKTGTNYKKKI